MILSKIVGYLCKLYGIGIFIKDERKLCYLDQIICYCVEIFKCADLNVDIEPGNLFPIN